MIKINVKGEFDKARADIKDIAQKQIPYATARALTEIAKETSLKMKEDIATTFKHAVPFTKNAMAYKSATKAKQESMVYVKPIQADYLLLEDTGGTRTPQGNEKAIAVPVTAPLNAYGNLRRGFVRSKADMKSYFIGTINGVGGLWQRLPGRKLKLVVVFKKSTEIQAKWNYAQKVEQLISGMSASVFAKWIKKAMETAK